MRRLLVGLVVLPICAAAWAGEPPVATIGTHTISRAQLEERVRSELIELDTQRYHVLREGLDEMIAEELLQLEAKARGITPEALQQQEVTSKAGKPTEDEIKQVYDANKDKLNNASLDEVRPRIETYLQQSKVQARRQAYVNELRTKYKTVVTLRPPVVEVGLGTLPPRGDAKAPVTIVIFSDYECPFCKQAEVTVETVRKTYGDKVRIAHRDFPLSFHQHAEPAAEAARCANAQGKFWEYHDKLFPSTDLSSEKLQALATEVGVDRAKFDACVKSGEFKQAVEKDTAEGSGVGVTGTPAFFVNGRMLTGAQPFEKFKELIDQELALANVAPAAAVQAPAAKPQ
jgi:protein-disulfide isomerase